MISTIAVAFSSRSTLCTGLFAYSYRSNQLSSRLSETDCLTLDHLYIHIDLVDTIERFVPGGYILCQSQWIAMRTALGKGRIVAASVGRLRHSDTTTFLIGKIQRTPRDIYLLERSDNAPLLQS
jgi:hypothetical protein